MLRHMEAENATFRLAESIVSVRGERSQQAFATAVGTSILTLREWEKGRRAPQLYRHVVALQAEGVPEGLLRAATAARVAA